MLTLKHDSDNSWFDVHVGNTYIGHICRKIDNTWLFHPDIPTIPDQVSTEIKAILHTLNL